MRVDAVGRTGDEGGQVLALDLVEGLGLVGQDDADVGDLVLEVASGGLNVEVVAHLDARQLVEHGRVAQAGVAGEDRVRGFAADGQGGAEEVADALVERRGVGAVVDRQVDVDRGDLDGRHDVVEVELAQVVLVLRGAGALGVQPGVEDRRLGGLEVVFVGAAKVLGDGVGAGLLGDGAEFGGDAFLARVVVLGREDGVQEDQDAGQQQDRGRDRQETPLEGCLLLVGRLGAHAFSVHCRGRRSLSGYRVVPLGAVAGNARGVWTRGSTPPCVSLARLRRRPAPCGACWPARSHRSRPRGGRQRRSARRCRQHRSAAG